MKLLFTLFLFFSANLQASANNYYFSSTGDDSRSSATAQNSATPWRTLSKLNSFFSSLSAGDHVYFKGGETFTGSFTAVSASGTALAPIVISSYGTGLATLSGFTTVASWTDLGGGIYESNVLSTGTTVNVVTIDGVQYAQGRYPNANTADSGYLTFESHASGSITDNQNILTNTWAGAELAVRTLAEAIERSTITGISGTTISYSPAFSNTPQNNFGYFVQNDIKTLDQFGEWYYNPSTNKLSVYFGGGTPSSYTVKASAVDNIATIHSNYITIDRLNITGANLNAIYADWQGISNLILKNSNISFSGINAGAFAGMANLLVDSCSITNSNSDGIDLFYNNINPIVSHTTINNTGTYVGMVKRDVGASYATGIFASSGLTATNNVITNTGAHGIYFIGNNCLIQNNFIQRFCTTFGDGGGIYTWVGTGNQTYSNRQVLSNIVLDGIGAREGTFNSDPEYNPAFGIYLDDNVNNVTVTGNTVANCSSDGIYIHNGRTSSLRDNTVYNNTRAQLYIQHDGGANEISALTIKANKFVAKTSTQLVDRWASPNNNFSTYGSIDSNYYCRPILETTINFTNWFSNLSRYYTLAQWQSTLGFDLHTNQSPIAITDAANILFEYNYSSSSRTVTLTGSTYLGLDGTVYSGSVVIPAYYSVVLLRTGVDPGPGSEPTPTPTRHRGRKYKIVN